MIKSFIISRETNCFLCNYFFMRGDIANIYKDTLLCSDCEKKIEIIEDKVLQETIDADANNFLYQKYGKGNSSL